LFLKQLCCIMSRLNQAKPWIHDLFSYNYIWLNYYMFELNKTTAKFFVLIEQQQNECLVCFKQQPDFMFCQTLKCRQIVWWTVVLYSKLTGNYAYTYQIFKYEKKFLCVLNQIINDIFTTVVNSGLRLRNQLGLGRIYLNL
jgi:hypothetical protein